MVGMSTNWLKFLSTITHIFFNFTANHTKFCGYVGFSYSRAGGLLSSINQDPCREKVPDSQDYWFTRLSDIPKVDTKTVKKLDI